jgi:hypothetical protein
MTTGTTKRRSIMTPEKIVDLYEELKA